MTLYQIRYKLNEVHVQRSIVATTLWDNM